MKQLAEEFDVDINVVTSVMDHVDNDIGYARKVLGGFVGEYDTLEDLAREHLDIALDSIGYLKAYFDFAAYARDQELHGSITVIRHLTNDTYRVYVFCE